MGLIGLPLSTLPADEFRLFQELPPSDAKCIQKSVFVESSQIVWPKLIG